MKTTHLQWAHAPLFFVSIWLLGSGFAPLAAQSFGNGDFSKGGSCWTGFNFKIEDDPHTPGNKVLVVDSSKKKRSGAEFGQDITIKPRSSVTIAFDVKPSADYGGEGFSVDISRPNEFQSLMPRFGPPGKDGRHVEFTFNSGKASGRARFSISLQSFGGKLYFDNFTVKPS